MSELFYATVSELPTVTQLRQSHRGKSFFPSDIASGPDEKYYKMLEMSDFISGLTPNLVRKFTTKRVQRILNTQDGEIKWRVLN